MWRAADTEVAGWTSWDTYATAYQILTSHEAAGRRSSNGRQGAGSRVHPSTRRGLSSPSMRGITSTTWSVGRDSWPSLSSSWQRWCHLRPSRPDMALSCEIACARKAHKVEDDGGDEACSGAPQAACLTTLATLRPLLGVSDPWHQISSLALGSRSTSASCSSLVEEIRPASSARGRGFRWTGQPQLSNRDVRA